MGIIKKESHCAPLFVYDGSLILFYIFCQHLYLIIYFSVILLGGVSSFLLLCISPSFFGEKIVIFSPFSKIPILYFWDHYVCLIMLGKRRVVGGVGGGALPAFVLNNVTFKCNRKRNSLLHIPRQRIQSPIISDFIVYLCRNY